jgi:hypothetical protein
MRHCVLLLVFCCFGLSYGSLASLQELDTPALANQASSTIARKNKAAKHSLAASSPSENRSIANSFRYLKSIMFGASTVPVSDVPFHPSALHQTASLSENRLSSLRKAAQDKVAPSPVVNTRSLVVGPTPVDMYEPPSVGPPAQMPAPVPMTRRESEPTDPPAAVVYKPQLLSCPVSPACPGKNLMYKQGSATCEVACVLESYVGIRSKAGWACGSCSG